MIPVRASCVPGDGIIVAAVVDVATPCDCDRTDHTPLLVVVTGGPGAGKTALLESAQRTFCRHVIVLPEAASILWVGGFPRRPTYPARTGAQRAIARVQRELERIAVEEQHAAVILCDRGTLDGLAYWPGDEPSFFATLGWTRADELARYHAVLHLRPPADGHGYPREGLVRVESAAEAAQIDRRIEIAWRDHPHRMVVDSDDDFVAKITRGLAAIRAEIPACCAR